jgi:predicted transposase/invertase (TIGR01784 family)
MNISKSSRGRYLNLFSDRAFRRVFGSERDKAVTLSLLNSILRDEEKIKDFHFASTAHIPDNPGDRGIVLDLHCLTVDGRRIVVELQKRRQIYFRERTLFYSTWPIQAQGKSFEPEKGRKHNWNYDIKAVYVISLLDFTIDPASADTRIVTRKMIQDTETHESWTDRLVFVNVELSRFSKKLSECHSLQDKWFFVLKNLHRLLDQPAELREEVFSHLFEITDKSRFDGNIRADFERSEEEYDQMKNALDYAIRDGLAQGMVQGMTKGMVQGIEQGIAQGREEGRADERRKATEELRAMVSSLKEAGVPVEVIARSTHLDVAEIEAL